MNFYAKDFKGTHIVKISLKSNLIFHNSDRFINLIRSLNNSRKILKEIPLFIRLDLKLIHCLILIF